MRVEAATGQNRVPVVQMPPKGFYTDRPKQTRARHRSKKLATIFCPTQHAVHGRYAHVDTKESLVLYTVIRLRLCVKQVIAPDARPADSFPDFGTKTVVT